MIFKMKEALERFKKITGLSLKSYFVLFYEFINNEFPKVRLLYSEGIQLGDSFFEKFENLIYFRDKIYTAFEKYENSLSNTNVDIWQLMTDFEDTSDKIDTIINSSKWYRASNNLFAEDNTKYETILKQSQSFESLSKEFGESDYENEWYKSKIANGIREEDYTKDGGNKLIAFNSKKPARQFEDIVGSSEGLKMYGTDFDNEITFDSYEQDLKVLQPRETMLQHLGVMVGLVRGSVPEFRERGIDKSLLINDATFNYPIILRQQNEVFNGDLRIKGVEIVSLEKGKGDANIELAVTTILEETKYVEV